MSKKINAYFSLLRLNKPIGSLLLLWPTLMSLWVAADGKPHIFIVVIFILGVLIMRSLGCVINDLLDKDFDRHVTRTQARSLVTGAISTLEAILLIIFLMCLALVLVLQLNVLTRLLSLLALSLACIYPLMKRYTHFPQVFLGAAFGMSIPMAFAATLNTVPNIAWLIFFANFFWIMAYDTEYAMADRQDDIRIGVKSTAIFFGDYDRLMIFASQSLALALFLLLGLILKLGFFYYLGWMFALILSVYQQYLIKDREPLKCFQAFLNNNMIGAALFVGLLFAY